MAVLDDLYPDVASVRLMPAVVAPRERPFGSARLIGANLLLTARHVVLKAGAAGAGERAWQVQLYGGASYEASVCWQGRDVDIALLNIHRLESEQPVQPKFELRIGVVSADPPPEGRLLGFPEGARIGDRNRGESLPQLLAPTGKLARADALTLGIDSSYRPKNPETDWPGCSGGAVSLVTAGPADDKIWIYGVAESLGPHFDNRIKIASLATAWEDREFRQIVRDRVPGIEAPSDPLAPPEECPYRGLEPFRIEDETLFFGRDDEIKLLLTKFKEGNFVAISGSTGCGKSSLVHGGLIPALRRNASTWKVVSMHPGSQPIQNLARAIGQPSDSLLQGDADRLRRMCQDLLEDTRHQFLLLYIEQWEELYSRQNGPDIEPFVSLVAGMHSDRVKVLVSIRDDLYHELTQHRQIRHLLPQQKVAISPIKKDHLGEVIERPAAQRGFAFDPPDLVQRRILRDADVETLPMLQYALKETWKQRVGKTLTEDGYDFVGGVGGAIRKAGDHVYGRLAAHEQASARQLFLGLIHAEDGQSVPAEIPGAAEYHAVIKDFENARLITVDNKSRTVQMAHGSIIAHWPALKRWWTDNQRHMRARKTVLEAKRQNRDLNGSIELADARLLRDTPGDVQVDDIRDVIERSIKEDDLRRGQELRKKEIERNVTVLGHLQKIATASAGLLNIDGLVHEFCCELRKEYSFDFVMVQLIDQAEQAIETIDGVGLEGDWNPIGKHSLECVPELRDIQAAIATEEPPIMEELAGWDDRFDEFIWSRFSHGTQRRIFAPILLGHGANLDWEIDDSAGPFNKYKQTDQDYRRLYRLHPPDDNRSLPKILGTVEAGFYNHRRNIGLQMASNVAQTAASWSHKLHAASLDGVLQHIAQLARHMWTADVVALQFHNAGDAYRYKCFLGQPNRIRAGLAGPVVQSALTIGKNRFAPGEALQPTPGFGAEAALPFVVDRVREAPRRGMLYLAFEREYSFSLEDKAFLEQLVSEATGAIRVATHLGQASAKSRRLNGLLNISIALARDPAASDLDKIAGYARILFGADVVTIYEYQGNNVFRNPPGKDGRLLVPDATLNTRLDAGSAAVRLIKGDDVFATPASGCGILYSPRRSPDQGLNFVDRERIRSAAGVNLRVFEEQVGVMFLNFRSDHEFTSTEKESIGTFARTAAMAIRTASRFKQS